MALSPRLDWSFKIILLVISISLTLVVCEVAMRILKIQPGLGSSKELIMEDPVLGFSLRPNLKAQHVESEYTTSININSEGFRSVVPAPQGPDDRFRIAVLGDSFTFGYGVDAENAFPSVMQQFLGDAFEVYNFGVPAYATWNEARLLENRVLRYNPSLVVVSFYIGNDPVDNSRNTLFLLSNHSSPSPSTRDTLKNAMKDLYLYRFLRVRLYELRRYVVHLWSRMASLPYPFVNQQKDADPSRNYQLDLEIAMQHSQNRLMEIKSLCDKNNVPLLVMMIPSREQVLQPEKGYWADYDMLYQPGEPQRNLINFFEKEKFKYFDLLPLMSTDPNKHLFYYRKDPHCTAQGYFFIGKSLAKFIQPQYKP